MAKGKVTAPGEMGGHSNPELSVGISRRGPEVEKAGGWEEEQDASGCRSTVDCGTIKSVY